MVKKLTYNVWKNIHELIYVAAPLAALHFYLLTKADKIEPMIYLIIIFILFAYFFVFDTSRRSLGFICIHKTNLSQI